MVGFGGDNKEFKESIELTTEQLEKNRKYLINKQSHYLVSAAVATMNRGVDMYWSKRYNLNSGQTHSLRLFGGLQMDEGDLVEASKKERYKGMRTFVPAKNSKFRGKGGRRLVSFTQEKPLRSESRFQSSLRIHSFPMNLYERDVRLKNGRIRTGTHIMRSLLPPQAERELGWVTQKFAGHIEEYFNKENQT